MENELLVRLDLLTAKLGVGATHLWGVWLSTWWMVWVDFAIALVVGGIAAWGTVKLVKRANANADTYNDNAVIYMVSGVGCGFLALVCIMAVLTMLSANIGYTVNHELYAIDQLQKLLHGGE
jgi:heme/copper-type cytochrome/quinol oxidase subunit 2